MDAARLSMSSWPKSENGNVQEKHQKGVAKRTRKEDENIPRWTPDVDLEDRLERRIGVVGLRFLRVHDPDAVLPAFDVQNGSTAKGWDKWTCSRNRDRSELTCRRSR